MGGHLFIVAEDALDLHDYLRRQFAGIGQIRVLLDRRRGERRHWVKPHEPERRRVERRLQPSRPHSDWFVIIRRHTD